MLLTPRYYGVAALQYLWNCHLLLCVGLASALWQRVRVAHARSSRPPRDALWAPPWQGVKGRTSGGWCFWIRCADEINGIARGLLIPFKTRNILSPTRMWKKLEQLHLYREPLYQREQGRGMGNTVEGTGHRVPILCSRLNSWA